jgi:hypothetical protein
VGVVQNHAASVVWLVRGWLLSKGAPDAPSSPIDLFPGDWTVGSTAIPLEKGLRAGGGLAPILPHVRAYGPDGKEVHWLGDPVDYSGVDRLRADWDPPVEIVAGILTCVAGKKVSKEDVLRLAQSSPQALEKLKEAGAAFKAHFTRLLDIVALRRSPAFLEVSARYKAQLRVLIEDQQAKIREARVATRRVNQLLGERDEELAKLDGGYEPKRATAAAALAAYGILLSEDQVALSGDGTVTGVDLEDLNF